MLKIKKCKNKGVYYSSLWNAVELNYVHLVKKLLDAGESVNTECGKDRETVLHLAARKGFTEVLILLLEKGADVNKRDRFGNSPLHKAASNEYVTIELLKYKSDINAKNSFGETPLHIAVSTAVSHHISYKSTETGSKHGVVNLLLRSGADVNKKDKSGNSSLHRGVWIESVGLKLINHEGDVNSRNVFNETPLHLARSESLVRCLIAKRVDINAKDGQGKTALFRAAEKHRKDILKILLKAGANVNQVCNNGQNALHIATSSGFKEGLNLLIQYGKVDKKENRSSKFHYPSLDIFKGKAKSPLEELNNNNLYKLAGKIAILDATGFSYSDVLKSTKSISSPNNVSSETETNNLQKGVVRRTRVRLSTRRLRRPMSPQKFDKRYIKVYLRKATLNKRFNRKILIQDLYFAKSWDILQETKAETWHLANERKKHKKEEQSVNKTRVHSWRKKIPKSVEPTNVYEAINVYRDCYFE